MGKKSKEEKRKKKKEKKQRKDDGDALELSHSVKEEEKRVERTPSTIDREEWMTKPKEGWLAVPKKLVPQSPTAQEKPEPKPTGLYVPHGSECQAIQSRQMVGDGGASWRLKALRRMQERSKAENKGLEEIARERGLDLDALMKEARKRPKSRSSSHRSYLDDIFADKPQMRKPRIENSAFVRRKRDRSDRQCSPELPSNISSAAALNKFPNDGSFLEMFNRMQQSSEEREEVAATCLKKEGEIAASGNASSADQLRQQLLSNGHISAIPQSSSKTEVVHLPMIGADGRVAPGVFGREGTLDERNKDNDDINTLFKRSKHKDDAIDIDSTLAKNISRRRKFNTQDDLHVDAEYDYDVGTDLYQKRSRKNRNLTLSDLQRRERRRQAKAEQRRQSLEDSCAYCFEGKRIPKHLIVSIASTAYLRLPDKGSLHRLHCMIVPLEHIPSTREVDENVWTEIRNFKKALIQMNASQGRGVIFVEVAMHLSNHERHTVVECVPVEQSVLEKAPIFFKKAIDDATSDWSQHHYKRCIETGKKGLRGSIPEHFPYFHVEFNISNGFVHVIDDEERFDADLGRRVLIGLLNRPAEEMYQHVDVRSMEEQKKSVADFVRHWHEYDWTADL